MCYFLYLIVRFLYVFFKKAADEYNQADGKRDERDWAAKYDYYRI